MPSDEHRLPAPSPWETGWLAVATLGIGINVYTRFRFGERYIDPWGLTIAFCACSFLAWLTMEMRIAGNNPDTFFNSGLPIFIYGLGILVLSAIHQSQARARRLRGEAWHSKINGLSWLLYVHNNPAVTHRYFEPLGIFVVGYFINNYINWMLGGYLMFSGFSVLCIENVISRREKQEIMDMRDQQIEAMRRGDRFRRMHPDRKPEDHVHQARRPPPVGEPKKSRKRFWRR